MRIKQKRLYLFLALMALLGIQNSLFAQNMQIRGKVMDDQGLPLPGVSVTEKNNRTGWSQRPAGYGQSNGHSHQTIGGQSRW